MKVGGVIHFILATILKSILEIPMYLINGCVALYKGELSAYNEHLAIQKDVYGNYLCSYVFNTLFLTKKATYGYGQFPVTISHVTAVNYRQKTLTPFGVFFAKILIFFNDKSFRVWASKRR